MQVCLRCLYSSRHPFGLGFDAEGVCFGCRVHEEKDRLDWNEREHRLRHIFDGYRDRNKGRHDCIVPITGGRDSFFIVHLVRKVYGLNPLLVVYNRHYNSRAGIYNIAQLRTVFGCDIVTMTLAPDLVRRIMLATLIERGSFHWHTLAGHTVFPVQTAVRTGIPLIVWGAHQGLEQVGMFSHLDEVEMTRRYRREHDLMGMEAEDLIDHHTLSELNLRPLFYPEDADLRSVGVRGIYLGNYLRWDTKAQHEKMLTDYDYYTGPLQRTFDNYNDVDDLHYAGVHDVIKMRKLGYGLATDHASREIRYGRLTREEGRLLARAYADAPARDAPRLAELLRIGEDELSALIHAIPDARPVLEPLRGNAAEHLHDLVPKRCHFEPNKPQDFEGEPNASQLLTRGYQRERNVIDRRRNSAASI